MEAWRKREMELREYVEEIGENLIHDEEGEFLSDHAILEHCHELLGLVIGEIRGDNKAHVNILATNGLVNNFSRTPAEAMSLKRQLIEKLLVAGFHNAGAEHLHQQVHEQGKLFAGHRAMDEVDWPRT